jgi:hypothetical protein
MKPASQWVTLRNNPKPATKKLANAEASPAELSTKVSESK